MARIEERHLELRTRDCHGHARKSRTGAYVEQRACVPEMLQERQAIEDVQHDHLVGIADRREVFVPACYGVAVYLANKQAAQIAQNAIENALLSVRRALFDAIMGPVAINQR